MIYHLIHLERREVYVLMNDFVIIWLKQGGSKCAW